MLFFKITCFSRQCVGRAWIHFVGWSCSGLVKETGSSAFIFSKYIFSGKNRLWKYVFLPFIIFACSVQFMVSNLSCFPVKGIFHQSPKEMLEVGVSGCESRWFMSCVRFSMRLTKTVWTQIEKVPFCCSAVM